MWLNSESYFVKVSHYDYEKLGALKFLSIYIYIFICINLFVFLADFVLPTSVLKYSVHKGSLVWLFFYLYLLFSYVLFNKTYTF